MLRVFFRQKRSFVALIGLLLGMSVSAQTAITDEAGLKAIANDLAGSYVLANDITLSQEWIPLGTRATPFTGTLDGAGHSIKGLKISTAAENLGLFSFTQNATVKNLRLPNVMITGYKQAGAVAGQAIQSKIDQVFASGIITGYDHIGGIVGDVRGDAGAGKMTEVTNCLSTVGAYSSTHQAGVLVGWINAGIITNNLILGSATAPGNGAGGIAPILDNGTAEITGNIIAPAFVSGYGSADNHRTHAVLGFVNGSGSVYSVVDNYYSTASEFYESGTLVADPTTLDPDLQGDPIEPAALKVATTYTGIGFDATKWSFTDGQYPVLTGMTYPIDGDAIFAKSVPDMAVKDLTFSTNAKSAMGRMLTIVSDNPAVVEVDGFDLKFVGVGVAHVTYTTQGDAFANGATLVQTFNVSDMNYNLSTANDLLNMKNNLAGDYKLAADIDMSGVAFTPLGEFTGTLDGQGHVIKNLTFSDKNRNNTALFSTMRGGTIKNVGIEQANLVGNANVAAFVGRLYGGTISQCYVANSYIEGRDHVAAFTGDLNRNGEVGGTISDCISDARIFSRSYQASGIAGVANGGTLERCLFSGIVNNTGGVAGLISLIDNNDWKTYPTIVKNCFSAPAHLIGGVNLQDRMIHLANRGATLADNYALASTIYDGKGTKLTDAGNKDEITGESVADDVAKTMDFYTTKLGWDMTNTWKFFEGTEGKMYPVLKWMKAPLAAEIFDIPHDLSLLYTDGSDMLDLSTMHGSWGQNLTFEIVEGIGKATYDETNNVIYAGDDQGYFQGTGDIKVQVGFDAAVAPVLTNTGADSFTFYLGQSGQVVQIATPQDFLNISKNLQGSYELTNDIDMAGVAFTGIAVNNVPFSGMLNGNGHKVKNLSVSFETGTNKGIFGQTSGAKFNNIAFENMVVKAPTCNHIGFIGSALGTTFDQVAITGRVYGNDHVALLAGDGDAVTVTNSYVWGDVSAYSQVGGFFGCTLATGATVSNSYYNGYVEATTRGWVGGFVGLVDKSGSTININNCVSIGDCSSTGSGSPHTTAPFIAGNNAGDTPNAIVNFTDNIYNVEALMDGTDTPWPTKNLTAEGGNVVSATSVNANTLKQVSTYTNINWNFATVWGFDSSKYDYPILTSIGYVDYNKELTGIGTVNTNKTNDYVVYARDNAVTVIGAGANAKVNVLNAAGQLVGTAVANGTCTVSVPGTGLYIVSIADNGAVKAYKVLNK